MAKKKKDNKVASELVNEPVGEENKEPEGSTPESEGGAEEKEPEKAETPEVKKPEVKKPVKSEKRKPGYYVAPGKSISVNRKGNLPEGTKVELDIFKNKDSLKRLVEKGVIEEVS